MPGWELAECVERLRTGLSAPGRLRLIAAAELGAWLSPWPEREPEIAGELLLGTAVGLAVAEEPRQGAVLALAAQVPQADDPSLLLAARLGLHNLFLLAPAPAPAAEQTTVSGAHQLHSLREGSWKMMAWVELPAAASAPPAGYVTRRRREWPPVQLGSLPRSGAVPWPAGGEAVPAAIAQALAWLAEREPRLLLPHRQQPWCDQPLSLALAAVLAQLAGEGRRVVWQLPPGAFAELAPAVIAAHRRGLGLKLLLPPDDLPPLDGPFAVSCWMVATGDGAQAEAVLAWLLAMEDPVLCALTPAGPVGLAPVGPYRPGAGRWLVAGADGTVVVAAGAAAAACRVQEALAARGLTLGVFECTSLAPPPIAQLAEAPTPWWMLTGSADAKIASSGAAAGAGLAALLARYGVAVTTCDSPERLEQAVLAAGVPRR